MGDMITVNPELLCLIASQMPLCCIQPAHPWYEYMQLAHPTQPRVSACVCVREGGGIEVATSCICLECCVSG